MFRLSRKTLLALEAVIDIAYNARPEPVQAVHRARNGLSQRTLPSVEVRGERHSVDDAVAGVPAAVWADTVEQHLDAANEANHGQAGARGD